MRDNEHKYRVWPFVVGTIIGLIFVLGVIEIVALIGESGDAKFTFLEAADKWIALIEAILPYAGTCFVGIIAMWQNNQLSKINIRLFRIEEVKLFPQLNFKPGRLTFRSDGTTQFSFIIEHKGGDIANNLQIRDIVVMSGGKELTLTDKPDLPQSIYTKTYRSYYFMCAESLTELDEANMTFTLSFTDVLNEAHEMSVEIHWDMQILHEVGNNNSNDPTLPRNDKRELIGARFN